MKRIDTSQVINPTSKQPFTSRSLKFLQDALDEDKAAFIKAMITQNLGSYSLSVPYVISGCVVTDSNKDVTAGEIFYGGKFFETTSVNGTTNIAQFVLTKTQDATADPLQFSDLVNKTVHDIYKYVATDTATPGDFDATDLVSAYGTGKISIQVESADQGTSSSSFVDLTGSTYPTPNDGVTRTWMVLAKSNVSIASHTGEGGQLRILVDGVQKDIGKSYMDILLQTVDLQQIPTNCMYIGSIAPNKIVKLQISNFNGTATVDFKDNKFIMVEI